VRPTAEARRSTELIDGEGGRGLGYFEGLFNLLNEVAAMSRINNCRRLVRLGSDPPFAKKNCQDNAPLGCTAYLVLIGDLKAAQIGETHV
jgi:hypothetical protein